MDRESFGKKLEMFIEVTKQKKNIDQKKESRASNSIIKQNIEPKSSPLILKPVPIIINQVDQEVITTTSTSEPLILNKHEFLARIEKNINTINNTTIKKQNDNAKNINPKPINNEGLGRMSIKEEKVNIKPKKKKSRFIKTFQDKMIDIDAVVFKQEKKINKKELDIEYETQIANKPEEIFDIITEEEINIWKEQLNSEESIIFKDDSTIYETLKNHENQNIIINDCNRTRVRETGLVPNFKDNLELFLTYYCKTEQIKYKQGLNEIVGPLLLLQYKIKISFSEIYGLINAFIKKFLTNYYKSCNIAAIHSSFALLSILLKYHEPAIFKTLEFAMITPEIYAVSWILTTLASKCRLDVVYHLWDFLIKENDNLMMFFIMVAFFHYNKEQLVNNDIDISFIPQIVTGMSIDSVQQIEIILQKALQLREATPYSYRILANNLELFQYDCPQLSQAFQLYRPDNITAMPFFPTDSFHRTEPHFNCPDDRCHKVTKKNNKYNKETENTPESEGNTDHICEHCDMQINKKINYLFLDLRITADEDNGTLLKLVALQSDITKPDFVEKMTETYLKDKGNYHFVFLTSSTDDFKNYEKYYEENISQKDRKKMKFEYQTKIEKELIKDLDKKLSKKEYNKVIEYDIFKKSLSFFLKADYPYISYAYGGFKLIHEQSFKYEIDHLQHEISKCSLCAEIKNSHITKLKENYKIIEFKQFKQIVSEHHYEEEQMMSMHNIVHKNHIFSSYLTKFSRSVVCYLTEVNLIKETNEIITNCVLLICKEDCQIYTFEEWKKGKYTLIMKEHFFMIDVDKYEFDKKALKLDIIVKDNQKYQITFSDNNDFSNHLKLFKDHMKKK